MKQGRFKKRNEIITIMHTYSLNKWTQCSKVIVQTAVHMGSTAWTKMYFNLLIY